MKISLNKTDKIIDKYINEYSTLPIMQILLDIQKEYNYVPEKVLQYISEKYNYPLSQLYGLVSFYTALNFNPQGKHIIRVCKGTACQVRGTDKIIDEFERILNIKSGETSKDNKFTLETVNCLGACAMGPVALIDDEYYGHLTPQKTKKIIKDLFKDS